MKRPRKQNAPTADGRRAFRWLAQPSRYAGLPRSHARLVFGLLALLLLASLSALWSSPLSTAQPEAATRSEEQRDVLLYESIVASVRHGGEYYSVTAEKLRQGNYPLRPFITFRLPTLAMVQAHIPAIAIPICLYLLAATTALAWSVRLVEALRGWPARLAALLFLAGGMAVFVQSALWPFHEIWAGLLVALSLALRRATRWIDAVAIGLVAALVRETAAIYLLLMAVLAWRDGARREAFGWALALALLAIVLGFHAAAVGKVVTSLDTVSPGWSGLLGTGFFVKAIAASTALMVLPGWGQAILVGLALFGWTGWRDPLATRTILLFAAFAILLSVFARTDTFYWALMIAPAFLVGLVFVPDTLRDLLAAALDRRRLRVQIVTR